MSSYVQYPETYNNFNPNRCNNCFHENAAKPCTPTKVVCKNCRLIRYCSYEHQSLDWKRHMAFCKAVVTIMKATDVAHILDCGKRKLLETPAVERAGKEELLRKIDCSMFLMEKMLGRSLQYHERVLLQQPVVCKLCHVVDPKERQLCNGCHQIAYCSKDHQEQDRSKHSKWCNGYRQNFILNELEPNLPIIRTITELDEGNRKTLPHDSFELASVALGREIMKPTSNGPAMEQHEEIETLTIAGKFSWVGTILYILSTARVLDELADQLVVFLVGAHKECVYFNPATCAPIFAFLPKLRTLRLHNIGPDTFSGSSFRFCYNDGERVVEQIHHKYLYHQLPKSCSLDRPQLIVAFNCGFNEINHMPQNPWLPTIRVLLQFHNVPFAFTSYTRAEAIDDCTTVLREAEQLYETDEKLTFVKRAAVNPFRDPRPYRNPDILDETDELYHDNGYLSLAIAKKYS